MTWNKLLTQGDLPEKGKSVLAYEYATGMYIAYWAHEWIEDYGATTTWYNASESIDDVAPTPDYWMELPEVPGE